MASGARLPVLFVQTADPAGKIRGLGKAAGHLDENWLPSIPVDAQDVVALYRVAHESIVRAREGSGPTRIVCALWPAWDGHAEDAVEHLERWLEARGLPAHEWRREILAEVEGGARASEPHVPSLRIHASQEEKVLTEGL
jgi:TPP-dependent pyruvate/acetoin dehydrogenase alpha subunit